MQTQSHTGHSQHNFFTDGVVQYSLLAVLMISITALVEPMCFTKAHHLPEWRVTITDELNALLKNGMRSLVSLYPSQNMVGRKCIFRIKHYADDFIERYKAHLVAKGFHHQYGFAYHERFSPVIKPSTILLVLGLAVTHGRSIWQLDVKNVSMNGYLQEEVFMTQPPSFVDLSIRTICANYTKPYMNSRRLLMLGVNVLASLLFVMVLCKGKSTPLSSFFSLHNCTLILLLYVDDIVLTVMIFLLFNSLCLFWDMNLKLRI